MEESGVCRSGDETDGEVAVVGGEEGSEVEEGDGVAFCHEREYHNAFFRCHDRNLVFGVWFWFALSGIRGPGY